MLEITWTELKVFLNTRGLFANYVEFADMYIISGVDGYLSFYCKLFKTTPINADQTDFETNFKPLGNKTLQPKDVDNTSLSRTKITKTGWHFQLHGFEFHTSQLNSVFNEDMDGNDLGFSTLKFYNSSDVELVANDQAELDANCVKTVATWEPDQDVEVIGGVLEQPVVTANNVRMWIRAIPDLTVAQGGSVPFAEGGINLKYINGNLDLDGKTPKLMPYNATNHTSKFEITMKHEVGDIAPIHLLFKLFRENV
jgi:hypothetical protein